VSRHRGLKLHLRVFRAGNYAYRVLSLRPDTRAGFSTNFFHETWHVVTDPGGSRLLARLLWGLAYERHAGTVIVIDGDHLLPTPFEAERSDPILLTSAGLTRLDASALRDLKRRLRRPGRPEKTVRWSSFGLDRASRLADEVPVSQLHRQREEKWPRWQASQNVWRHERMGRLGGFIVYTAPPPVLRMQALLVGALQVGRDAGVDGMDYHFLAERTARHARADGEVQVFADYRDRVAAAVSARRELVANPKVPVLSETLQEEISRRRDRIKACRLAARERGRGRVPRGCPPSAEVIASFGRV
jgi:hypothetical protein